MIIVGRDWGKVAKCPFCDRTNIPRAVFNQLTCGGASRKSRERQATSARQGR